MTKTEKVEKRGKKNFANDLGFNFLQLKDRKKNYERINIDTFRTQEVKKIKIIGNSQFQETHCEGSTQTKSLSRELTK